MATTPNFSWVTPAPTDFVTDLPADFETFADAVDTDVWAIKGTADAALPETLIDAAGDLIYGSAADTAARLAIGTAGQVLTVNSGATAPEWKDASGGGLTQLATHTFTGQSSLTFSNISQNYQDLILVIQNTQFSGASYYRIGANASTSDQFAYFFTDNTWRTDSASYPTGTNFTVTNWTMVLRYFNYKATSSEKLIQTVHRYGTGGNTNIGFGAGLATTANAITSIKLEPGSGTIDSGVVTLFGA